RSRKNETKFKSCLMPLVEMGKFLHNLFEVGDSENHKNRINDKALKECSFWDFISPFYTANMSNIATYKWLTKINLAIQLLIGAFDKKTSKFKFADKETACECSLEPRDFAIMFKIRMVTESEELKKLLKQKNGPEPTAWLKNKFRPEKDADISEKITKVEIERKLKDAAKDESDPQHFMRLFAMWLCTIFFFTDAGTTGLAKEMAASYFKHGQNLMARSHRRVST
ncbi:hypothetical protein MKW98_023439, partial [Papaver atlanticum]